MGQLASSPASRLRTGDIEQAALVREYPPETDEPESPEVARHVPVASQLRSESQGWWQFGRAG